MKSVIFLIACVVAVAVAASSSELFDAFVKDHNKSYLSDGDREYRLKTFSHNLKTIEYLNSLNTGATYGATEFADMSPEEFQMKYLGLHHDHQHGATSFAPLENAPAPASFDWRDKGAVTEVKNQGQCGSCWAYSTTGNIEGVWQIAGHKLTSLSEQNLVDCDTKLDQGCNGGLPSNAFAYIMSNGGLDTEASYPYTGADGKCQYSKANIGAQITNWTAVVTDEAQIAAYLAAHGPLSIGINAMWMQFYFGGVSDPMFCDKSKLDHGVLIVGYGTDASSNKPYWIIKNSWGASWGEKGYYRIARGKGACGLNTMVTSAIV